MSKIEEAAREFIQNNPILKHGILEDEVPKLMADFATSQLFNQQAKTVRQKIAELERENKTLLGKKERVISIRARLGKAHQQIEQLTDKLERRDKHIVILEELRDVLTQELDFWKIGSFDDKIKAVTKEREEWRDKYNDLQLPFSHRVYIPALQQQLSAEKQKNEELEDSLKEIILHLGNYSDLHISVQKKYLKAEQLLNK